MARREQRSGPMSRIIEERQRGRDDVPRGSNPAPLIIGVVVLIALIGGAIYAVITSGVLESLMEGGTDSSTQLVASPLPTGLSLADVIEAVSPAIVQVEAQEGFRISQGSGVIITEDGYLLTNAHVIEGSDSVNVRYLNGEDTLLESTVIGIAVCSDLAVLKLPDRSSAYPTIAFRPEFDLRPGDEIYSLGFPLNASRLESNQPAVRDGTVSRIDMQINNLGGMIEHGAPINSGNSGGALIDRDGNVVGINTLSIRDEQGLFYAVGLPVVQAIWTQLSSGQPAENLPVLQAGTPATGELLNIDERHCYVFDAVADQRVILTAQGRNLDPHMWLYSPQNQYVADNDDYNVGGGDTNSRIELFIPESGRYQVVIHSTGVQNRGEYTLNLQVRNP